jgi:hypothetical protein
MAMGDHRPALPRHRDKRAKPYSFLDQNVLAPRLLGAGCGVFLRQRWMGLDLREDRIICRCGWLGSNPFLQWR